MNSAATPVIEYRIVTDCNRIFSWSATSPESAMYELLRDKGLSTSIIMPFKLWESLQEDGYKQGEYIHELQISTGHYQLLPKGA